MSRSLRSSSELFFSFSFSALMKALKNHRVPRKPITNLNSSFSAVNGFGPASLSELLHMSTFCPVHCALLLDSFFLFLPLGNHIMSQQIRSQNSSFNAVNGSGLVYLSELLHMSTFCLIHYALLLTPACRKSNSTNARL